jgi:hypothetical protein
MPDVSVVFPRIIVKQWRNSMSRGVVYIATGQKSVEEACASALRTKQCMPELPISLITDLRIKERIFHLVEHIEEPQFGPADKVRNIARSPYRDTLYLDSDTYVVSDVREVFLLLERFDFAASHSPYRVSRHLDDLPECFPEYNAGVLLFRQSEKTGNLFSRWREIYEKDHLNPSMWLFPGGEELFKDAPNNQPSLRRALFESDLRIATLTPEYNCRLSFPGFLQGRAKILHGRTRSLTNAVLKLNRTSLPRVHLMHWGKLRAIDRSMPPGKRILNQVKWSLHYRGPIQTSIRAVSRIGNIPGSWYRRLRQITHS